MQVVVNLFDKEHDTYCCRTVKYNIAELESQTTTHSHFKLSEPMNIYFYTKSS